MARCCGGSNCSCILMGAVGDIHVEVTGSGSAADPYVIEVPVALTGSNNPTFEVQVNGTGTPDDIWSVVVDYALTAKLDHVPDVNAPTPTNGQVLGWDSATQTWTPRNPTSAASGSVLHDTSLTGDGSAGAPLQVAEDPARGLATTASGLGFTDAAINSTVRRFPDEATRAGTTPAPTVNTLSTLDTAPGQVDYYDGSSWHPIRAGVYAYAGYVDALLEMSGPWSANAPITMWTKQVAAVTDAAGQFEVVTTAELTGVSGVLAVQFQEGTISIGWKATIAADTDRIVGTAYRLDTGAIYTAQAISGVALITVY